MSTIRNRTYRPGMIRPRRGRGLIHALASLALVATSVGITSATPVAHAGADPFAATPDAPCGPGSRPETVQGRVAAADCGRAGRRSSSPPGVLGHEGGFAPDGNTFYVSSAGGKTLAAIDVTNPATPSILWLSTNWTVHGLNVSNDGNRIYFADLGSSGSSSSTDGSAGLTVLDVSQIQKRVANPQVKVISHLTWPQVSIPQTPIPVTITTGSPARQHRFLVEVDEYSKSVTSYNPSDAVGAARIINIDDERHPIVVSNLRLAVNSP